MIAVYCQTTPFILTLGDHRRCYQAAPVPTCDDHSKLQARHQSQRKERTDLTS